MKNKPINAVALKQKLQKEAEKRLKNMTLDEQIKLLGKKYGHLNLKNKILEFRQLRQAFLSETVKKNKYYSENGVVGEEAARRLAKLGGTEKSLTKIRRRRSSTHS
jgi:hypothetical protein